MINKYIYIYIYIYNIRLLLLTLQDNYFYVILRNQSHKKIYGKKMQLKNMITCSGLLIFDVATLIIISSLCV